MKFVGRINLTKQELLDIIFKHETIALDQKIIEKFSNDKKTCIIDFQKVIDIISAQKQSNASSQSILDKQQPFTNDQLFFRAFLVVLLLQIANKKGAVRPEFAQFLIQLINSSELIDLSKTNYATQPWQILELFYEEGAQSEQVKKVEGFEQFTRVSESESQVILKNLEKIYVFALALRQLDNISRILNLSVISYAFYCESGSINTEFLQIFEKKAAFARNISIVSYILQNLLMNSALKKTSASEDDTTWIELCGQSRYNMIQLLNFIVEELGVEDIEGLKLKGNFERTTQTLNSLSLQLAGSIAVQFENTFTRIQQVNETESEEYKTYILEKLAEFQKINQELLAQLSFVQREKGFCQQLPYILNLSSYTQPLQSIVSLEVFKGLNYLDKKNAALNPKDNQKQKTEEELKQEEEALQKLKETNPARYKQQMKAKDKPKKVKKIGFGAGTALIFEIFNKQVQFSEQVSTQENYENLVNKFFKTNNIELMSQYEELTTSKNSERRKVKVPKGTQDFGGKEMALRKRIFDIVKGVYRAHGAVEIDTPVFELKETLTGKYGEDSKLIYDLEDQGGELLSLRYDLTVPFARFMATEKTLQIKRYQMQKVYRRDQPNITKGRFREFYQCDFDISGKGDSMLQDAEVITVFDQILNRLNLDKFLIKINNRKILDAMIEISGAPMDKFKPICSAIDKLDKEPWEAVRRELVEDKGINEQAVDKIGTFVNGIYTGKPQEVLEKLFAENPFKGSQKGEEALNEMKMLFDYLQQLNCINNVSFDLSLARGLDYYTGMIFEIVLIGELVGSIAGGGRYDELIGMFMDKKDAVPSVGGSLGIERVYRILSSRKAIKKFTETEVLVCTVGNNMAGEKLKITGELWNNDIKAEYLYREKDKSARQLEYAIYNNIPFSIWIGEDEVKNQQVTVKNMYLKSQETLGRGEYIDYLKKAIAQYYVDVEKGGIVEYYDQEEQKEKKEESKKQE